MLRSMIRQNSLLDLTKPYPLTDAALKPSASRLVNDEVASVVT